MANISYNYGANIIRRKSRKIFVGNVAVGGDAPITVQTMTNVPTQDYNATIKQIIKCAEAGAEIIRVSVPDKESTEALKFITKASPIPIVADVHFHYKRGIEAVINGAKCIRINPGNIGTVERAKEIARACKDHQCSIRIGVNGGSLEETLLAKYGGPCPEALTESAMNAIHYLEDIDFHEIKISLKASNVPLMINSYKMISKLCDYPLHLGVTEAGSKAVGSIKSALGIGALLFDGIGDTIRVSLTALPEEEIPVCFEILKSLGLRKAGLSVISCPSCARQQFDVIKIVSDIEKQLSDIKETITLSILGCVVNGLGEAMHSDIGVTGAMNGNHIIYVNGVRHSYVKTDQLVEYVVTIAHKMAEERRKFV